MSDCLWGLLDGMNDAGLAVSLTYGGRRVLGHGFGIPLVLRYLLETCDNVRDASRVLKRLREEVLLLAGDGETRVGSPRVAGASVVGKVLEHGRGQKIRVFHYKKRKHNRKTRGHRQDYTALHIEKIQA